MATIFRRPGSPYWYARFQYNGQPICFSTETANRKEALNALKQKQGIMKGQSSGFTLLSMGLEQIRQANDPAEQERTLDLLFNHVLDQVTHIDSERKKATLRHELAAQLLQGTVSKLTVADTWRAWLKNPKKRNPMPLTLSSYEIHWRQFTDWLAKHNCKADYLHEIGPAIAEQYVADLWGKGISPSTYNRHLTFLRGLFNVMKTQAGLTFNPWADIPKMEKEQESKRNLEPAELVAVCSKAKGSMRYWFAIGLYTGLRLGDVVTLKWDEVKLTQGMIERVPSKTRRKNKKIRFPIHPVLDAMLRELRAKSAKDAIHLFLDEATLYKRDTATISKMIQKHFTDCGIKTTEEPTNGHRKKSIVRVGFHSLRHSFVSLCAANRIPQVTIMEMVGHGSPAMTALYSHAGDEQKAKAIAALPDVKFGTGEKE